MNKSIAFKYRKKGLITRQGILVECVCMERQLIEAGFTFETMPRLYEVISISSLKKDQLLKGFASDGGIIAINEIYIGTTYFTALRDTISHELAHASIGIGNGNGHNAAFRKRLTEFRSTLGISEFEIKKESWELYQHYRDTIQPARYKIFIELEGGDRIFFKYAERTSPIYIDYETCGYNWLVNNKSVARFIYEPTRIF